MIRSADGSVLARAQTAPARTKRGSALLVTLLVSALLVLVPAAPAGAIQTISWVVPPPGTANLGDQFSFTWTGRADTFLGARITGCFANFLDGNNYSRSFGGNFTTGSCTVSGRTVTTSPTYPITAGFTLSTGGQMTMGWNISVQSPTPTVVTSGNQTVAATSVAGAPVTYSAYGTDNTYGTYGATCIPQSGYTFAPGTSTVQCQATNPAGKTGYAQLQVTVTKATPTIAWNPPASIVAGTTFESLMSATAQAADATGSFTYSDVNGNSLNAGSILPVGDGQQIQATWAPSTQASAAAFTSTSTWRTVDVTRRPQSVQFVDAPTSKAYGDAPFTVVAAGTAGGAAVLVSTLPGSACSVAQHSYSSTVQATVTITGVGPCVLSAFQIQDGPWAVSPTVQHSVTVAKGTPELTVTPTVGGTHGARWGDLLAVASNVPGSFEYFVNGDPVSPNDLADVGTSLVHVQLTPFDQTRYTHAIASTQLTVVPAVATLDVTPASGDRTYGDAPIQLTSTTNSPGAVVHSVTGPCSVAGSIVTILGAGTCTTTSQVPATGTFTASPLVTRTFTIAKATPTVTWATPEAIAYGTPLDAAQLNAVVSADLADPGASLPLGSYVYTPAEGTVLDAGTHLLHVTFVPFETESTRWNAKAAVVELTVSPANPVITWDAPSGITYGTPLGADQLDASATSAGTFEYSPAAGTVLGAGDHSLNVLFTSTDPNYLSGMTGVPLTVTKAAQAIDFEITGIHTYGDAPFGVSATGGGSGNPVTFAAVPGSICAVVGTTVTITGAGPCVIAASQAGDDDHLPAPTVTRSATVDPAVPTIAWDAPEAITHGTALGATQLDASIVEGDATGAIRYFLADGVTPADGVVLHAGDDQVLTAVFEPDAQGSANYVPTAATVTIDVAQATQTITFDELAPVTFGDAPFAIAATGGGSGLPVTFAATGDGCTVNGTTVTVAHAGTCTITASQAGNDDFLPATDVSQVLAVAKAGQTIELGAIADHTFGDAPFTVDVTPGASSSPVLLAASGGACSVSGTEVTILHAGPCVITANQGGDDDHLPAPGATVGFTVARAAQAISFAPLTVDGTATYLDAALEATVSGGLSGEPVVLSASGDACSVVGTTVTIDHAGQCAITASQAGTDDFLAAPDVTQTLTVARFQPTLSWTPSGLTYGDPIGDAQLNATASPEATGAISYSVSVGEILGAGTHDITATFAPDLADDVASVTATVTVTVDQATQTITFDPIDDVTYGDEPFTVSATGGDSGQPVTFSSGTSDCDATAEGTVTINAAGDCSISADQAGDDDFLAASTVTQFFGVGKATPDLDWSDPDAITFGTPLGDDELDASADVDGTFTYTPAAGSVLHASAQPQTLTVRFDPSDTDNYVPVELTTTIVVERAAQELDLDAIDEATFGDEPFDVDVDGGDSGEPIVLGATGDCTVDGDTVTITAAGGCTITADQAGNSDFFPASQVSRSFAIAKGAGSVSLDPIDDGAYAAPFDVVVTPGPLGGAVTLSAVGPCSITPSGQVSVSGAGSCTVTATQAPGTNVLEASVSQTFTALALPQVIVFGELAERTYGDAAFPVSATPGASGQPVVFAAVGEACTAAGSTVTVVAAGTCTITASQAGGPAHLPATPVSQVLTVRKATLVVTPAAAARSYRQANPTFGFALTGFVGGDTAGAVATLPTCSTTATTASPVGRYPITCAGGSASSYDFTYKTATLTVGMMPTRLTITNPSVAVAGSTVVSATLTDALTGEPVIGEPVILSADLTARTSTSSPATMTVDLAAGLHVIGALYLGDANHRPAIDGQLLVSYQPTRFVIWGGNTGGVRVGEDYTFFGSQWSKQVKQGSYGGGSSFKGFATTSTNAAGTTWSTTGSSAGLPAKVGDVISVLVSTSITKSGPTISGNVTKQVLLVVDDPRDYRPNGNGTATGTLLTSL